MERGTIFNLPNSISLSRLLLAFAFVVTEDPSARVALILTAGATDFLDGWLARRAHSFSVAGALIDPLADRIFVLAAVSSYLIEGSLTTAQYFIFLSRDIATGVGFIVARFIPGLSVASFKARALGKTVTGLQLVTLFAVLVFPRSIQVLVLLIGGLSAVSIVDYTAALERARREASRLLLFVTGAMMQLFGSTEAFAQQPSIEVRADAIISESSAVHAGLGITVPTGTYLRSGVVAGLGSSRDAISGRVDIVNRFHLDPFREKRWAPYVGGGLSTRFDDDRRGRVFLLIFAGLDAPSSRGVATSFEAGFGGGARVGIIVRRAEAKRR